MTTPDHPLLLSADPDTKRLRENHVPVRLSDAALTTKILAEGGGVVPDGVVTSPQGVSLEITNDPDHIGEDNAIVFLYETWQHFADLSTDGLTKLTPRLEPSTRWTSEDGFVRHAKGTVLRTAQTIDALDEQDDRVDVEIAVKMKSPTQGEYFTLPSVVVRASGEGRDSASLIYFTVHPTKAVLGRYVNGEPIEGRRVVNFPDRGTDAWTWVRLRVIGNRAQARFWEDGETEPDTWLIEDTITEPELLGPGWVGLFSAGIATADYAAIGVANSGATAPTGPVAS